MELHIKDRLLIPSLFPERNSFMEYNIKKSIIKKIAISEKDKEEYNITENAEQKRIEWDMKKDFETPLVVEFTKEELEYMKKSCENMSEQDMPDDIWNIAERIYNATQQ